MDRLSRAFWRILKLMLTTKPDLRESASNTSNRVVTLQVICDCRLLMPPRAPYNTPCLALSLPVNEGENDNESPFDNSSPCLQSAAN
jgi:hypothetical protein